jgi:hypothetical protein
LAPLVHGMLCCDRSKPLITVERPLAVCRYHSSFSWLHSVIISTCLTIRLTHSPVNRQSSNLVPALPLPRSSFPRARRHALRFNYTERPFDSHQSTTSALRLIPRHGSVYAHVLSTKPTSRIQPISPQKQHPTLIPASPVLALVLISAVFWFLSYAQTSSTTSQ